jgi:hypothetical protein
MGYPPSAALRRPVSPVDFRREPGFCSYSIPATWIEDPELRRGGRVFEAETGEQLAAAVLLAGEAARAWREGIAIAVLGARFVAVFEGGVVAVRLFPTPIQLQAAIVGGLELRRLARLAGDRTEAVELVVEQERELSREPLRPARLPGDLCPACGERAEECQCNSGAATAAYQRGDSSPDMPPGWVLENTGGGVMCWIRDVEGLALCVGNAEGPWAWEIMGASGSPQEGELLASNEASVESAAEAARACDSRARELVGARAPGS